MKKILAIAAALVCLAAPVNAQSVVQKLGDKAKGKVNTRIDKKVDQVMDKALNKVFGTDNANTNNNAAPQQNSGNQSGYIDNAIGVTSFGADLYTGDGNWTYNLRQGYDEYELKSTLKFGTYAEAMKYKVDLPSAKDLADPKAKEKFAEQMQSVEAALDALVTAYNNAIINASANYTGVESASKAATPAVKEQQSLLTPTEIFTACANAGIDLETASDQEVINACVPTLMKKTGCTEAEARALLTRKEDKSSKNSNRSEIDRADQIYDQLSDIYTKQLEAASAAAMASVTALQSALLGGSGSNATQTATLDGALRKMVQQFDSQWTKSEECKKVNSLQQDKYKKGADAKAITKEQNKIIDAWNEKQADKWLRKISEFIASDITVAKTVADLDAELEAMSAATKNDYTWTLAKRQAVTLNFVVSDYVLMPAAALLYPEVKQVEENDY